MNNISVLSKYNVDNNNLHHNLTRLKKIIYKQTDLLI